MQGISLTDFVDIVAASGTPKATKVRQVKNRPEYHPAFDYYKQIRDAIVLSHRRKHGQRELAKNIGLITDPKKLSTYDLLMKAYKKWWGRKELKWFAPPEAQFSRHGVQVRVNPELGLRVNGTPHLVKLYFKSDQLSKSRIDLITHLMEITLQRKAASNPVMSVLDIRRSRLFTPTVPIEGLSAALGAELAYIAALLNEV